VETVKGFAQQEKSVLEEVTRLRSQWGEARQSGDINKSLQAAQGLDGALGRLMVVVEKYPELKSNQNFMKLQDQLEGTENRVSVERKRFNDSVLNYNKKIRAFPGALFAASSDSKECLFSKLNRKRKRLRRLSFDRSKLPKS